MKKTIAQIAAGLTLGFCGLALNTVYAKPAAQFDHSGIRKGSVQETCYHSPCSVSKDISYRVLSKTATETKLEYTILGGSREWEAKKIDWNTRPHKLYVTCSVKKPTLQIDQQKTLIPFNLEMGVPGALTVDAEVYLHVCHNADYGDMDSIIRKFGYNVHDE